MNTLAFEEFESLDADYLAQVQGEGWIGAIAGGVGGFIGGAALGVEAAGPLGLIPGFGWATEAGVITTSAGAGVGYNTPL